MSVLPKVGLLWVGLGIVLGGCATAAPASPSPNVSPIPAPSPTATPRPTPAPAAGLPQGPFSFEPVTPFSSKDSGMALTVTIPAAGWIFGQQWADLGKGDVASIVFWAFPGEEFYVPADACRMTSTRPDTPSTTVDEIAASMAAQASRDASEPEDVTVGGHDGKLITLHVPEDVVPEECEEGHYTSYMTSQSDFWFTGHDPGHIEERWVLDVDATVVIIDAIYRPDTSAELVEEMRAIVESTTFERP